MLVIEAGTQTLVGAVPDSFNLLENVEKRNVESYDLQFIKKSF